MELTHTFSVPVPRDETMRVLLDVERIAPCMPGAQLEDVSGDEFAGTVRVKLGPITAVYKGTARIISVDDQAGTVVIEGRGKETRGTGTANATITSRLRELGGSTEVTVLTDLAITGKPAQFGRGMLQEVGGRLVAQFADALAAEIGESTSAQGRDVGETAGDKAVPAEPVPQAPRPQPEALDLLGAVAVPLAKRVAPGAGLLLAVAVLAATLRRRRRR